eukprot:331375-Prorocentrum_minimum.AAC.1
MPSLLVRLVHPALTPPQGIGGRIELSSDKTAQRGHLYSVRVDPTSLGTTDPLWAPCRLQVGEDVVYKGGWER